MSEETTTDPEQDIIPVESLDSFMQHFLPWHERKTNQLRHMLTVPDGMGVQVGEDTNLVLTGDALIAFRIGIELGLSELGTLPFSFETENDH